jgi:hypothetical protein
MFSSILSRARQRARAAAVAGGLCLLIGGSLVPLSGFTAMPAATLCAPTDYQCVIKYGDAAIAARQTALSTLNGRVTGQFSDHRISASDNATLTGDISSNESGLSALKTKLDADTDAKTARADFKTIYTTFRIFAVVLPRDYHELWLDMIVLKDGQLQGDETLIQDAINGAPASVRAQANQLFTDYKTQVTNSQAQASAAQQIIPQLTPSAFNSDPTGYETTLATYRTDIHTAAVGTKAAISDLHQIVVLLKGAALRRGALSRASLTERWSDRETLLRSSPCEGASSR